MEWSIPIEKAQSVSESEYQPKLQVHYSQKETP